MGFGLGAGLALAAGGGWAAISGNYGEVPPAAVMESLGPVIACYGGRDRLFRAKGEVLTRRLAEHGKSAEVHVFPEVGHSFLTDGDHPIADALSGPFMHTEYKPEVAELAWEKILGFFERHIPV